MSSKEKICLHEREKHPSPALPSSPAEDEEEEGQTGQGQSQGQEKASSSSSSEEESESESDAESGRRSKRRGYTIIKRNTRQHFCHWLSVYVCRESEKPRAHQQLKQQAQHQQPASYLHVNKYCGEPTEKGQMCRDVMWRTGSVENTEH